MRRADYEGTPASVAAGAFGPGGALYVCNVGFGAPVPGLGEVLKVVL